jgi:glycosyltransferase involved in cell wall biosynthesis
MLNVGQHPGVLRLHGTPASAMRSMGEVNVVHDNGIWLAHNHRLAQLARSASVPRIVSIRGMLEPWARRHRATKKAIAWWLYQRRDLSLSSSLHAATEVEAAGLGRIGLDVPVRVIPNGVDIPVLAHRAVAADRIIRNALFLGRIYPVKGLDILIRAWEKSRPDGWRLTIAGPDERGHRNEVERMVERAGLKDTVHFAGPAYGIEKSRLFEAADLFVLPTRSESFGMAIAEALAHAVPVLTTTAAPWPMLEGTRSGWRVDAEPNALAECLSAVTRQPPEVLSQMGLRGRAYVEANLQWSVIAKQFISLYEEVSA